MEFHPQGQGLASLRLEGQIHDQDQNVSSKESLSLLNEPIRETVLRSVRAVGKKFSHVLFPRKGQELLKECKFRSSQGTLYLLIAGDLWGPLTLCLILSVMLHRDSKDDASGDGGPEFAQVFVIFWLGAALVTLNSKLLGGAVSFLQTVCVLGYCILPLVISLICVVFLCSLKPGRSGYSVPSGHCAFGLIYSFVCLVRISYSHTTTKSCWTCTLSSVFILLFHVLVSYFCSKPVIRFALCYKFAAPVRPRAVISCLHNCDHILA
ncbi:Protein YIPF [Fasciola gigantica]|uniref:Protein YIPF n=1 Tax=Fasciola gigantica TaxID=46835 RepID=A0A504Z8T8_FASGI|nr:Protein YIPF [Fasciola gigantica]